MPHVEFLAEALSEAAAAAEWYAERSGLAAAAFAEEVDAAIDAIEHSPRSWPPYDHGTRRFVLRRFPYFVVYSIETDRIVVVAIVHAHRRPNYWRSRIL